MKQDRAITIHLDGGHTLSISGSQNRWQQIQDAIKQPGDDWLAMNASDGSILIRVRSIVALLCVPYELPNAVG